MLEGSETPRGVRGAGKGSATVLDLLSVLGEARPHTVRAILDDTVNGSIDVDAVLDFLLRSQVIRSSGSGPSEILTFRNATDRHHHYESLNGPQRRRWHTRAAEVLTDFERWPHRVAAATTADEPLTYELLEEAERLIASRPIAAARLLALAVEVDPDADRRAATVCRAVRFLVLSGRFREALKLRSAVTEIEPSAEQEEVFGLLGLADGRPVAAADHFTAAAERFAAEQNDEALLRVRVQLSGALCMAGSGAAALAVLDELAAEEQGHDVTTAVITAHRAWATAFLEGPSAALAVLHRLPDRPIDCPTNWLTALAVRGLLKSWQGSLADAAADLTVASRRQEFADSPVIGMSASVHLSVPLIQMGEWHTLLTERERATAAAARHGRVLDLSILRSQQAIALALLGRSDEAAHQLRASVTVTQPADHLGPLVHQSLAAAMLAHARQDPRGVVAALSKIADLAADPDRGRSVVMLVAPFLCDALISVGETDQAERFADTFPDDAPSNTWVPVAAAWVAGRLAEGAGDSETAAARYERAARHQCRNGEPVFFQALSLRSLARCRWTQGETEAAVAAMRQARVIFERMGGVPYVAQADIELETWGAESPTATDDEPPARQDPRQAAAEQIRAQVSEREWAVVELVGRGLTNKETAAQLHISPKTVDYHLGNAFAKLQVNSRRALRDLLNPLILG